MKIGLLDIDRTKFPNLALMKISAYHKALGDHVEFYNQISTYDLVYSSKIFNFTPNYQNYINSTIIHGGTGNDVKVKLPKEIENTNPDYSLYKTKHAYGFITRGCNNHCKWCVVPIKEGKQTPNDDIENIIQNKKSAILMDNNILASDYGLEQLEKIIKLKIKVDFNQGLDARLVTKDIVELLSKIKWLNYIRFACDSDSMIDPVLKAIRLLDKYFTRNKYLVYFLLDGKIESCYNRMTILKNEGININPQPYRDLKIVNKIPQWQKDFAHWGSRKWIYNSCDFKEFKPRKDFICRNYFITI